MSWDHFKGTPRWKPASGIPAKGKGWGGPKSGSVRHGVPRYPDFSSEEGRRFQREQLMGKSLREALADINDEEMVEVWRTIAMRGESEFAKISAVEKIFDRKHGKVSQTVNVRRITSLQDLTVEELADIEAEALRRVGGGGGVIEGSVDGGGDGAEDGGAEEDKTED